MQNLRPVAGEQFWALKQNSRKCDSICSTLSFGIPKKICLVCMNHVYLQFMTGRKCCARPVTNYWTHTKFPYINNVMMGILEDVGNFRWSIKNDTLMYILLCICNLGHCKWHFPSTALPMRVVLMPQHLFVVGDKPFPANQKVKTYECFHCDFQIWIFCR